jgi:hypothetical protein
MNRFRLPVGGIEVVVRPLAGSDDVALLEAHSLDISAAIALLSAIARRADDNGTLDWATMPLTDVDALLLKVHQIVFGDLIRSDVICPNRECGKRIEVSFSAGEFLEHCSPRPVRRVTPDSEPGWYRFTDAAVSFRLATAGDLSAASHTHDPYRDLIRRCLRPSPVSSRWRNRAERAMEAMAPRISRELAAECAECGAEVLINFDARDFTLRELRDQAAFIYEDMHLLARHYHWPEAEILALPQPRRIQYVEMVLRQGASS